MQHFIKSVIITIIVVITVISVLVDLCGIQDKDLFNKRVLILAVP